MKSSSHGTVIFEVMPLNSASNQSSDMRGLTLVRLPHSDVTLWKGSLELDSGNMEGRYESSLGTMSVMVEYFNEVSELVEDQENLDIEDHRRHFERMMDNSNDDS